MSKSYELYVQRIVRQLREIQDTRDQIAILNRAAGIVAGELEEGEVQEILCNLGLELEVSAGRAGPDDMVWVTYSVKS